MDTLFNPELSGAKMISPRLLY